MNEIKQSLADVTTNENVAGSKAPAHSPDFIYGTIFDTLFDASTLLTSEYIYNMTAGRLNNENK